MNDRTPLVPGSGEGAAERAAREAQHQVLIELLGAYADRELPPETASQIDAHLIGCARCRREVAVHRALHRRLGVEPPVAAPPALRERIAAAIAATPIPEVAPPDLGEEQESVDRRRRRRSLLVVGIVGLVAASGVAGSVLWRAQTASAPLSRLESSAATVPLLRDILQDYRRVTAGDLPGRARDLDAVRVAMPFPIEPLRGSGLRLLAAWTTELDGEPAAVLAYRWDDRILLEYLVAEERFFHHPSIRRAVADAHLLVASDGSQGIAAWPTSSAGAVLVGDLPAARLAALASSEALARTTERGAQ